jgi:ABC-2 type transport system ATP-binding protein
VCHDVSMNRNVEMTTAGAAIRTVELTKVYPGDVRAVDSLDLEVSQGELFGLLGPNGAGKSTTAGMLTGRVQPTSGTAFVDGLDVWKRTELAKQLIGVVPQSNTLDRALSVRDNLYHHGRYFGLSAKASRASADDLLQRFRLADRDSASVLALSGGMAQRLMVARALMHEPAVLFLDEPTTGLDPQSRLALWDIMRELQSAGQTILLTTHYMEEADQLCDRIAIIDHGRLLALDTPDGLKDLTKMDTIVDVSVAVGGDTERLIGAVCEIEGVDAGKVLAPPSEDDLVVVRFGVKGREGMVRAIVNAAEDAGIAISDLSVSEPSLETVFIELTGRDLRE